MESKGLPANKEKHKHQTCARADKLLQKALFIIFKANKLAGNLLCSSLFGPTKNGPTAEQHFFLKDVAPECQFALLPGIGILVTFLLKLWHQFLICFQFHFFKSVQGHATTTYIILLFHWKELAKLKEFDFFSGHI
jgi:hypothetical protein